MLYENLSFPTLSNRPYLYANNVMTLDGKVKVIASDAYWPIGSDVDYQLFIQLRVYADAIIQGKNTALQFGAITIENIHKNPFLEKRKQKGKTTKPLYVIVCNQPGKEFETLLQNEYGYKPVLVTTETATVSPLLAKIVAVVRFGKETVDIRKLAAYLHEHGQQHVSLEGGPTLLGSFLKENLVDELFVTIAPKLFGNERGKTLTMVEGTVFLPEEIKKVQLLSVETANNEIFLRYKIVQ